MRAASRFLVLLSLTLVPSQPKAAGFYLYEIGTPSVGLASAGYAARAADAETLFTNPAGMTRLQQTELLAGVQGLYGSATFAPAPRRQSPGTTAGTPSAGFPAAACSSSRK